MLCTLSIYIVMTESPNALRLRNRKRRAQIPEAALAEAADNLFDRIIPLQEYHDSQHIAAYWAVNGEIGLDPVIQHALQNGKNIYLPILDEIDLRFAPYDKNTPLRINRFKLPEPDVADEDMRPPADLDLVLAPLVVFDADRNRIGMGGGYYDRTFEFRRTTATRSPRLIGVAHELQRVDQLHPEEWDVRLDAVVTDQHIYR